MSLWKDAKQIAKRDPAARGAFSVALQYSGFRALIFYKVSHFFYKIKLYDLARWNSELGRRCTGVGTGNNCMIYHGMTLGDTGHGKEKRHFTPGNDFCWCFR